MFIVSFKSSTIKLFALLFCVGVIFVVAVFEGSFFKSVAVPSENQAVNTLPISQNTVNTKNSANKSEIKCDTNESRVSYLENLGFKVDKAPFETQEIIIPSTFNSVYSNYNSIQKKEGFDLSAYKGRTATRYSYSILNFPDKTQKVKANLIILDSKLIGGDISSASLDGFMKGLCHFDDFTKTTQTAGR